MTTIRLVAWNISEGSLNASNQQERNIRINQISSCLFSWSPDIVMLNEVCKWHWLEGGMDQIAFLAQRGGYNYVECARTATKFLQWEKNVAVLSRFPLLSVARIEHSAGLDGSGYATVYVTANINDRKHHIFSTRFNAWDVNENLRSHETIRDIISAIPNDEAVILGGDFNTGANGVTNWPTSTPRTLDYNTFAASTQLRHVLGGIGWTEQDRPVDHILVRGAYTIANAARKDPFSWNPSDHPWVIAELLPLKIETIAPVNAIASGENEIVIVAIAKREQGGSLSYSQWAEATGWQDWTPFHIDYGSSRGFLGLALEDDRCYMLWVGPDGWVYHKSRTGDGQWLPPWPVGNSNYPLLHGVPGGAVHGASCQPKMLHVFYANAEGNIFFARRDTAAGGTWPEHGRLSSGVTSPGGHVTAVSRRKGQLDAFCVGTDGGVYTSSWNLGGQWSAWMRIGDVVAQVGNYVCLVTRDTDMLDIFVVDTYGRTMSAAWEPGYGWRGWWHIQSGVTAPSGWVTAVSRGPNLLDLFTRGTDGRVYTAAWSPAGGWGGMVVYQ